MAAVAVGPVVRGLPRGGGRPGREGRRLRSLRSLGAGRVLLEREGAWSTVAAGGPEEPLPRPEPWDEDLDVDVAFGAEGGEGRVLAARSGWPPHSSLEPFGPPAVVDVAVADPTGAWRSVVVAGVLGDGWRETEVAWIGGAPVLAWVADGEGGPTLRVARGLADAVPIASAGDGSCSLTGGALGVLELRGGAGSAWWLVSPR